MDLRYYFRLDSSSILPSCCLVWKLWMFDWAALHDGLKMSLRSVNAPLLLAATGKGSRRIGCPVVVRGRRPLP